MKILVTGGAGFIGSNVVDRLILEGYNVVVVDNLSSGKRENVDSKAKFYEADIRDSRISEIFETEKPEIVIHNAAQISVRDSVKDPIYDAEVNIIGSLNILELCKRAGVKKVIFASSGGTVYGEQKIFPASEDHPLSPISPYGVAKLAVEKYLYYYYFNYGLKYVSLRYANVYGPRQDPHGEAGVVAIFCSRLVEGKNPVINGDGKQTRDYVYVSDVVEANINAIECDFVGELNIGTGKETDVVELFYMLKEISGKNDVEEVHGPPMEGEQRRSCLDYEKAKLVLGWEPIVKLEEGLKLTYHWFKEIFKGGKYNK
ncbi:MAG: NAD-dependent epimerase/dehydratase family protein [Actinobacteria bacterium]|nr:NAD-dependent epimerase/dehydratase family protein [Actinomycetota bacterium]